MESQQHVLNCRRLDLEPDARAGLRDELCIPVGPCSKSHLFQPPEPAGHFILHVAKLFLQGKLRRRCWLPSTLMVQQEWTPGVQALSLVLAIRHDNPLKLCRDLAPIMQSFYWHSATRLMRQDDGKTPVQKNPIMINPKPARGNPRRSHAFPKLSLWSISCK